MKHIALLLVESITSVGLMWIGLSGRKFLWVTCSRAAAISLSSIGFVLCMASIGKFISAAPAHPLTIGGYLLGCILLLSRW